MIIFAELGRPNANGVVVKRIRFAVFAVTAVIPFDLISDDILSRFDSSRSPRKNTSSTPLIMSKPPLFPEQTASGIAVDPRTLDRVVPESRRADGSYATYPIFT